MVKSALMAAIICIFSVVTVPIGAIPVTMSVFSVMLIALFLDTKESVLSVVIYILLGAVGLPVFSGFKVGFQVLAGATGGYIWSYIVMAYIIGKTANKTSIIKMTISCIFGLIVCYLMGTCQFMAVTGTGVYESVLICVVPFVIFDILKAFMAAYVAYKLKKSLQYIH